MEPETTALATSDLVDDCEVLVYDRVRESNDPCMNDETSHLDVETSLERIAHALSKTWNLLDELAQRIERLEKRLLVTGVFGQHTHRTRNP